MLGNMKLQIGSLYWFNILRSLPFRKKVRWRSSLVNFKLYCLLHFGACLPAAFPQQRKFPSSAVGRQCSAGRARWQPWAMYTFSQVLAFSCCWVLTLRGTDLETDRLWLCLVLILHGLLSPKPGKVGPAGLRWASVFASIHPHLSWWANSSSGKQSNVMKDCCAKKK